MNTLSIRLLSLILFVALYGVANYWAVILFEHQTPPPVSVRTQVRTDAAAELFGGRLTNDPVLNVRLVGILVMPRGAAAIVNVGGGSPRAMLLGSEIAHGARLAEVRNRSIVVERNGERSEILLPTSTPSPATYVR